jgi:hypothetical protein
VSTISVDYDVLNQRGSPAWFSDTFANIPTAGFKGRMFISTDTFAFYRDTGTGWDLIGGPGTGTLTGSGVAGQVSFFNGTQTITGNNNLFWDNTNSRLGIGTITPLGALHLFVSAGATRMLIDGNAGQNKIITYRTNGLQRFGLYVSNTAESGSNVGSDFQIRAYNDAGTLLTTPFFIKRSSSRVGINNITPSYDLDVTGTFRATSTAIFGSTIGNGTYTYTFPSATGTLALTSDLSSFITLTSLSFVAGSGAYNNTTGVITIPTNNNQITNGAGYITSAALSSYLPLTGGTLTGALVINPTNTLTIGLDVASNTTRFRSDNLEGFKRQLEITMSSGTLVQIVAKGYLANYGTDLAFYTATTGGTNASPGIYITGTNNRVGIKTGTPAYDLDVTGTFGVSSTGYFAAQVGIGTSSPTNASLHIANVTSSETIRNQDSSAYISFYNAAGTTRTGYIQFNASSASAIVLDIAQPLTFNTGGVESMRIRADQNVGIGTGGFAEWRLYVKGIGTSAAAGAIIVQNNADTLLFSVRNDGLFITGTAATSPINNTTASLANANIGAAGDLRVSTASSKRFKDNIVNWTENGLDTILALKPRIFNYKESYYKYPNVKMLGLIAEEVAEVCPYLAEYENEDRTGQIENVRYSNIVVPLIKAIQELNEKLVRNNIN